MAPPCQGVWGVVDNLSTLYNSIINLIEVTNAKGIYGLKHEGCPPGAGFTLGSSLCGAADFIGRCRADMINRGLMQVTIYQPPPTAFPQGGATSTRTPPGVILHHQPPPLYRQQAGAMAPPPQTAAAAAAAPAAAAAAVTTVRAATPATAAAGTTDPAPPRVVAGTSWTTVVRRAGKKGGGTPPPYYADTSVPAALAHAPINGSRREKKGASTPVVVKGLKKGFAAPRNSTKEEITANAAYVAKLISKESSGAWKALDDGVVVATPPTITGKMVLTFPCRRAGEAYCKGVNDMQLMGVSAQVKKPKSQDDAILAAKKQREAVKASRKPQEERAKPKKSTSTPLIDLAGEKKNRVEKRKREQRQTKEGEETAEKKKGETGDSPSDDDDDDSSVVNSDMSLSGEEEEEDHITSNTTAAAPAAAATGGDTALAMTTTPNGSSTSPTGEEGVTPSTRDEAAATTAAVVAAAVAAAAVASNPAPRGVPVNQSGRDDKGALGDQTPAQGEKTENTPGITPLKGVPKNLEKGGTYLSTPTPTKGKTSKISGRAGVNTPIFPNPQVLATFEATQKVKQLNQEGKYLQQEGKQLQQKQLTLQQQQLTLQQQLLRAQQQQQNLLPAPTHFSVGSKKDLPMAPPPPPPYTHPTRRANGAGVGRR